MRLEVWPPEVVERSLPVFAVPKRSRATSFRPPKRSQLQSLIFSWIHFPIDTPVPQTLALSRTHQSLNNLRTIDRRASSLSASVPRQARRWYPRSPGGADVKR